MYGLSPGWIFGNQEGISLEGIAKRKGGKHRKYKRPHDPVADLMLRPGEVLEQDSTPGNFIFTYFFRIALTLLQSIILVPRF